MDYNKYAKDLMENFEKIHHEGGLEPFDKCIRGKMKLLFNLQDKGGCMQAKELADASEISNARVTAILNSAEKDGHIRRENISGDRRKINVILTEKGAEECNRRRNEVKESIVNYLEYIGENDTKELIRIFEKVNEYKALKKGGNANI